MLNGLVSIDSKGEILNRLIHHIKVKEDKPSISNPVPPAHYSKFDILAYHQKSYLCIQI